MADDKKKLIEENSEILVRIFGQDIFGNKNVYSGLTRIKGVSWTISNVLCKNLGLDKQRKISDLSKGDISEIEKSLENLEVPGFLKNRRADFDTGEDIHLLGVKAEMKKDFDIKRLKQIKSYKGIRHTMNLPVRGQRTRSHFRKSGVAVGVRKPKVGKKG